MDFVGRCQSPHGLLERIYGRYFRKELSPDYLEQLQNRLRLEQMDNGGETAAAASLRHSLETGKNAVSSFDWLTTSALAQVTLVKRN